MQNDESGEELSLNLMFASYSSQSFVGTLYILLVSFDSIVKIASSFALPKKVESMKQGISLEPNKAQIVKQCQHFQTHIPGR